MIQQGWLCPQCMKVNSPYVTQCLCAPAVVHTDTYRDPVSVITGDDGVPRFTFPKTREDPMGLGPVREPPEGICLATADDREWELAQERASAARLARYHARAIHSDWGSE